MPDYVFNDLIELKNEAESNIDNNNNENNNNNDKINNNNTKEE